MNIVVAVHTGIFMVDLIKRLFVEILPEVKLKNIVDDSIIADLIEAGGVTPAITKRMMSHYHAGVDAGADIIFNTCSSTGEVADLGAYQLSVPMFKIDLPLATKAVERANSIGILATLPTTLGPTVRLIRTQANRLNKPVTIVEGLANGAFDKFMSGDTSGHDQMILDTANRMADQVDIFVLAQASMSRMEDVLSANTGLPVFSSPRLGVSALKAKLEEMKP